MIAKNRPAFAVLLVCVGLTAPQAFGAEADEETRWRAQILAAAEARHQEGYCVAVTNSPSYLAYITRACQAAVKNRLKSPEDCSPDNMAKQAESGTSRCLAMPADEFDKMTQNTAPRMRATFISDAASKGIDGEALLKEARGKLD